MINYEKMMEEIRNASANDVKRMIFEADQDSINKIKAMEFGTDFKKELIKILKDRTFFEMLLINSLK